VLIDVSLPPGAFRNGTNYQASGRWYDVNRVRWRGKALLPIGGWRAKSGSTVSGKARAIITWRDNAKTIWAAIGTHTKLYAMTLGGAVSDITPAGFTAGEEDSSLAGGFGSGSYGTGPFGTPRPNVDDVQEASAWTLDTLGQHLVACLEDDGRIHRWLLNTGVPAAPLAGAPTAAACFVTNEGAVVALAAGGEAKRVRWSDAEDPTSWTASATNTAGGISLQTYGTLRCGKRIRGANLVFTDLDVWTMTATFDQLVYGFERIGQACGVISKQAVAAIDEQAVWMGPDGFWLFNGSVAPLPCEVHDRVFGDLNSLQGAKVYAVRLAAFSEVWWFYPSAGSIENDRYVSWNYATGDWSFGELGRTCGTDKSVFLYPLMVDAGGVIYEHEVAHVYSDGIMPHAEGGPLQLGAGDQVMRAHALYPDEAVGGQVRARFKLRFEPNGAEGEAGPYTLSPKTDVRFTARQAALRLEGVAPADWRVGAFRLDVTPAGLR
jgi:hypothetical protein